jgi:hypothetical protein
MAEFVTSAYDSMSEPDRARYEQDHFDLLPAIDKFRVANREFSSGMTPVGQKAAIIDMAYGNGDGQWTQEDAKILEEKRNDMGFLNGMKDAGSAMFSVAAVQTGSEWFNNNGGGFQLGVGGMLGGLFNSNASGAGLTASFSPDTGLNNSGQNMGLIQRLSNTLGIS